MPTISRAKRQKARRKRTISTQRRDLLRLSGAIQKMALEARKHFVLAIALLRSNNLELTTTSEMLQDTATRMNQFSYAVNPSKHDQTVLIVSVSETEEKVDTPVIDGQIIDTPAPDLMTALQNPPAA